MINLDAGSFFSPGNPYQVVPATNFIRHPFIDVFVTNFVSIFYFLKLSKILRLFSRYIL